MQPSALPAFRFAPLQRLRDWRRSCGQLVSLARNGLSSYRLAKEAIEERKALQRKWEFIALLGLVRSLRPAVIVEIGTYQGGTLYCWGKLAQKTATIVSIDLPGGEFGGGYSEADAKRFQDYLQPGQTLHCLRADSHAVATLEQVRALLGGRPVDFLFIDGDHTYEGVKRDFNNYAPLVRPRGLIALHDVSVNMNPDCQVHRFWQEIKPQYAHHELIDRDGFDIWGGIGVVVQG